jgi:hypothetical protein
MRFNQNISRNPILIFLIIFELIIIYLFLKNSRINEFMLKSFDQKYIEVNVCGKYIHLNDDMIELLRRATKLNIKLFIAEPQRLIEYLDEKQMRLFKISDNSTEIETDFKLNKILLGIFESNLNRDQSVSNLKYVSRIKVLLFLNLNIYFLSQDKLLSELKLNDFECGNAMVGQSNEDNRTVYRYLCTKRNTEIHIIKFLKKNNFYIIKELSNASIYTGKVSKNVSNYESAFDKFELKKCISDDIICYLPKQLTQYISQTKISGFLECNKNLANYSKKMIYHSANGKRNFKHSKQELDLTKIVKIDQNCENSEVLILIHSAAYYFDRRQSMRKTWISEAIKFNISVYFVVGEPKDNETQNKLELESFKYKDLIQFGFKESYYNVTLKHIALLRWAQRKCLNTKYLMKADDDIIVNVRKLIENLNSFKNGINGILVPQKHVNRVVDSQWFVPQCIYPDEYYPDYVYGGAYIMTKDTGNSLTKALEHYSGVVIDIDDIFITGILAEFAGIERYYTNKMRLTSDCKGRIDFCLMFNTCVLMSNNCKARHTIRFWKNWQNKSQESCKK